VLVLTRLVGERIQVGDDVVVTIVRIEGGKVKVGVDAPDHIKISRMELLAPSKETRDVPASCAP